MVKIIIIEGPDGSGKTTLVNFLGKELGVGIAPRVVSKDTEAMVDLKEWVDKNLDQGKVPQIFDRHRLISETIYGPIVRGTAQPGFSELSWMGPRLKRFYDLEPLIIYCLPPLETVKKNLSDDPDNITVKHLTEAIYQSYVSRIALDLQYAPLKPLVWNYETSPRVNGFPTWFSQALKYTNDIIKQKGI